MEKIIEDLNWRYACKQFDTEKKITDKDFDTLMESLRLTPSSYGLQPWKFVVVENSELREKLVGASWKQAQVKDASHLLVLCSPLKIDDEFIGNYINDIAKTRGQEPKELDGFKNMLSMVSKKSDEDKYNWAKNQVYIALGNIMTVCAQMRIDSCPMEGFQAAKYDEILGLEKMGLRSMVVLPMGYRHADDKYTDLKKVRYTADNLTIRI